MPDFSVSAIMLRRINYGDSDLIISFFTRERGKISVMAKAAKKSVKRFGGILELFSLLDLVCTTGKSRSKMVFLKEAVLKNPYESIRSDILKTAYAGFWAELTNTWLEEGVKQVKLFNLLEQVLNQLDQGPASPEILSILFQLRFSAIAGIVPNLSRCCQCGRSFDDIRQDRLQPDFRQGGFICSKCSTSSDSLVEYLSQGTLKQLQWLLKGNLDKALRIRFAPAAMAQGKRFIERFILFHLGRNLKSYKFLNQIRN